MISYKLKEFGAPLVEDKSDVPIPKEGEVVVKITASGVCHSDLHLHKGSFDLGTSEMKLSDTGFRMDRVLGHEMAGTVVSKGSAVSNAINEGQTVAIYPWGYDQRSLGINLDGGYSSHVVVPEERYVLPLPDSVSPDRGCLIMCSGITAYSALKKVKDNVKNGGKVVIIGCGGVGLQAVSVYRTVLGSAPVVVDLSEKALEAAKDVGGEGTVAFNSGDEGVIAKIVQHCATEGGVKGIIDFVGAQATATMGLQILTAAGKPAFTEDARNGKLVVVGLYGGLVAYPLPLFVMRSLTVEGSYVGSLTDAKELIDLAEKGILTAVPTIPRPLSEVNEALNDLREGKVKGRQVLKP